MSMPNPSPAPQPRRPHRPGTLEAAGIENHCSERQIRVYAAEGLFDFYKVRGRRGVIVDLDEVAAALRTRPARWGGARVIELPAQVEVVNDGLSR